MKNSEIYLKAADEIEVRGLNQDGNYAPVCGDPATCPVCVVGAIRVVTNGDPNISSAESDTAVNDLADWLRDTGRLRSGRLLPDWNDHDCRSAGQVISALRDAAHAEALAR